MADQFEYPQRWLREHKAIPSDRGWERATTGEILKCQKGLIENQDLLGGFLLNGTTLLNGTARIGAIK